MLEQWLYNINLKDSDDIDALLENTRRKNIRCYYIKYSNGG